MYIVLSCVVMEIMVHMTETFFKKFSFVYTADFNIFKWTKNVFKKPAAARSK